MKRITAREAQEMDGIKGWRYAVLLTPINGKFAKFKNGAKVRVKKNAGRDNWTVERDRWRGSMVPLCNRITGVPRICFDLL